MIERGNHSVTPSEAVILALVFGFAIAVLTVWKTW